MCKEITEKFLDRLGSVANGRRVVKLSELLAEIGDAEFMLTDLNISKVIHSGDCSGKETLYRTPMKYYEPIQISIKAGPAEAKLTQAKPITSGLSSEYK